MTGFLNWGVRTSSGTKRTVALIYNIPNPEVESHVTLIANV